MKGGAHFIAGSALTLIFLAGCVPMGRYDSGEELGQARGTGSPQASPSDAIRSAEDILKHRPNWDTDCSHFVLACYHSPEMTDFLNRRKYGHNLVYDLNYYLTQKKTRRKKAADIQPGDILVFNKTYDINGDGHIDDRDVFTHAGIVESFQDWVVTYIDASKSRKGDKIKRRSFSFYPRNRSENGRIAVDPATGREILHKEAFYAAYYVP